MHFKLLLVLLQRNHNCNHYNIKMTTLQEHLINHGVKPSLQRMAILKYLMGNKSHPTADMIYNDLYEDMPTLSKTTVYNTLRLLSESGVILAINIEEKNVRYDADLSPHAHFRCKGCGKIYDIPLDHTNSIYVDGIGELKLEEVHLYYKGQCKECAEKNNN